MAFAAAAAAPASTTVSARTLSATGGIRSVPLSHSHSFSHRSQSPLSQTGHTIAQTQQYQQHTPDPMNVDPYQSVLISSRDLSYLKYCADTDAAQQADSAEREKRATLKHQSHERYKNWTNTLEAHRSRKNLDRQLRLQELERAQQIVDQKEAQYQEASRRAIIDRANRMLYNQTDQVKQFHGATLLAAVLKERSVQLDIQAQKKELQKRIDQEWVSAAEQQRLKDEQKAAAEVAAERALCRELAATQITQLQAARQRQLTEHEEELRQGEKNKRLAAEALIEARQEELARHERMREQNREYWRSNQEQHAIKEQHKAQELEEEAKIEKYASEKERIIQLRKEHEALKFHQKQARFESMIKRQHDHLKKLRDQENRRIEKQMVEEKKKNDDKAAAEQDRAIRLIQDVQLSRSHQLARKKAEAERQAAHDKIMIQEWNKKNKEMEEAERMEEIRWKESAKKSQTALREQMISKEERARLENARDYEEARQIAQRINMDDDIFKDYVMHQMCEAEQAGLDTTPLKLVLWNQAMTKVKASHGK